VAHVLPLVYEHVRVVYCNTRGYGKRVQVSDRVAFDEKSVRADGIERNKLIAPENDETLARTIPDVIETKSPKKNSQTLPPLLHSQRSVFARKPLRPFALTYRHQTTLYY